MPARKPPPPDRDRTAPAVADAAPAEAKAEAAVIRVVESIAEIDARAWDACANPQPASYDPFVSHAFLLALESTACVSAQAGWLPQHLALETADGRLLAAMPLYLKSHSRGEYVFDHGWADALERAGGRYYPKLQSAVPFSPVSGRRFLVRPGPLAHQHELHLLAGAIELTERQGLSSLHITFTTGEEWQRLGAAGLLQRTDKQFHWHNADYANFDAFLAALSSRKRKTIRKERQSALASGLAIEWLTGTAIKEAHWDAFYRFYMDTGSRKWGTPYLNRAFFSALGETLGERVLLVMANRDGRPVAGALNLTGGDTLYGRYWGSSEHHECLHFEVCYYQAIEYAIKNGLSRVEAGAQGEHKLARGYVPETTYSLHHLPNPSFRRAVADYLERERQYVAAEGEAMRALAPFRKDND